MEESRLIDEIPLGGDEQSENDAHRLLGVVAAVRIRQQRGAQQLRRTENSIRAPRAHALEDPVARHHDREAYHESYEWRDHDERERLDPLGAPRDGGKTRL